MTLDAIHRSLVASYKKGRGVTPAEGLNLPSEKSVNALAADLMRLLFPGFFEEKPVAKGKLESVTKRRLALVSKRLGEEIEKVLTFEGTKGARVKAKELVLEFLAALVAVRDKVQTDVQAAYEGDPAAQSVEEIILAYPCVLVISLQRVAHVLYKLEVPILPRMLTEYAHERTGADIHPGAEIGTHFFVDHCTGVVIGETARIGNHVKIYQGVTLGAKSFELDRNGNPVKGVKRHPDIGDKVTIYSNATILGGSTRVGSNSVIGANVWLRQSVPEGTKKLAE